MSREDKERLYTEHIDQLLKRKREKFRELLDETPDVTLTSSWKDVKRTIKDDPRYTKFSSSERVSTYVYYYTYMYSVVVVVIIIYKYLV